MTKYTLLTPIEHNGTTYSDLTFREAETGDVMAADSIAGETSKVVVMLASMAGVPIQAFRKIKLRDLNKIINETASLMGESPSATTGG